MPSLSYQSRSSFFVAGDCHGVEDNIHTRVAKFLGCSSFSECLDGAYQTNRN